MSWAEKHITDHALLRWLERVHGIDIGFFREELARKVRPSIEGGAVGLSEDGVTYVFPEGRLITVKTGVAPAYSRPRRVA